MNNKYWIKRGDFSNVYSLEYTRTLEQETEAERQGFERITRKEAEHLCSLERDRRKHDQMFSGFADDRIWPFGVDRGDVHGSRYITEPGYVIPWPADKWPKTGT